MARTIKTASATAQELRDLLNAKYGIGGTAYWKDKALRNKLIDLGFSDEQFELPDAAPAPEASKAGPAVKKPRAVARKSVKTAKPDAAKMAGMPDEELHALFVSQGFSDQIASDMVALRTGRETTDDGIPLGEDDVVSGLENLGFTKSVAQELLGLRGMQKIGDVFGPGLEDKFVTVNIRRGAEKHGDQAVHVLVNGVRIDIPRGVDWPIRTPFLEALMHSEEIVYDEIKKPEEGLIPKKRIVLSYPVICKTAVPYDRERAEDIAREAQRSVRNQNAHMRVA